MLDPVSTAYDEARFADNFPPGIERHFWFRARTAVLDRTLAQAVRRGWIPPSPSILEVGCGTGIVVAGLAERGYAIGGVDLGAPPHPLVADRLRTGIRAQDIEPTVRARIDVLLFCDVIEHVPDDVALLRDTLAAFPNCRAVIVTVPARQELWSDHDRHYGHFRRYDRARLASTLAEAGLDAVQNRYMFRSLYAVAAAMRLAGRERDPVMRAPTSSTLHGIAAAVLQAEDRVLGGLPLPGLSLLGIGLRRS